MVLSGSTTVEACQGRCQLDLACVAFRFDQETDQCQLKSTNTGNLPISEDSFFIAGPQYCLQEGTTMSQCFEPKIHYNLEDLVTFYDLFTAEECQRRCQTTHNCQVFTHRPDFGFCHLKAREYGRAFYVS